MKPWQFRLEYSSDEISILDLVRILFQQKWLILIITLFCLIISGTYIICAQPVYEAKVYIAAPREEDVSSLNIDHNFKLNNGHIFRTKKLNAKEIYQIFTDEMLSTSIKKNFFKQVYWPSLTDTQRNSIPQDKLYANYSKQISIKEDTRVQPNKYTIIVSANSPTKADQWLKEFITLVKKKAISELVSLINKQNNLIVSRIQQQIDVNRRIAKVSRMDRIVQLNEALLIAKASGIKNFSIDVPRNSLDNEAMISMMYMRGTKALESEIKTLMLRKKDDSFIPNLRELESELYFYSKIVVPVESIKMFHLDGMINSPKTPITPKIFLILMLGIISGFILGSILALIRSIFLRRI